MFVEGTGAHGYWSEYGGGKSDMRGYAVEITGVVDGKIRGNIYETDDYAEHARHVFRVALPATTVTISYDDKREVTVSRREYDDDRHRLMSESGNVTALRFHPEDEAALAALLTRERSWREALPQGKLREHVKEIAGANTLAEAERVMQAFQGLTGPEKLGKKILCVPLSREFNHLASSADQDKLFSLLPFKSLHLAQLKGEKGVHALISADENLYQPLKTPKKPMRERLDAAGEKVKAQSATKRPAPGKRKEEQL